MVFNSRKLVRSLEFLELYKLGLSYQEIGNRYGLTRERVRQVLNYNPAFSEYLKEREQDKVAAEKAKQEDYNAKRYAKSLAGIYPKQVAALWDYEKNGDLKPEEILAGCTTLYIWLKCPIDGYSWKKKPNDVTISWGRNGTSGCPVCAGRTKSAEKQPRLIDVYPRLVKRYWNYEKNEEIGLELSKITLGSNKKAWFKCPIDGNEWEARIVTTVKQQWSEGNAGCRVCNGTEDRKLGEWKRRDAIAVEFPEEVAKYWHYEKNDKLQIDPMKLTVGSSKEAWFKCPIDGHVWKAKITVISRVSWAKGNNGCPACRGFVPSKKKR